MTRHPRALIRQVFVRRDGCQPAAVLCAVVFWPGVVSQANLDAKPANAPAAAGVLLALGLTVHAARACRVCVRPWQGPDWGRLGLAAVVGFIALPWIGAELGFFLDGVPLLGSIFQTGKHIRDVQGLPAFPPAVHHGHHHGMDGLLLVLTALLLSRVVGSLRSRALRTAFAAYLALMFCYGVGNIANDFWLEQVVKRGWATWEIPNVLEPRITVAWAVIALQYRGRWQREMPPPEIWAPQFDRWQSTKGLIVTAALMAVPLPFRIPVTVVVSVMAGVVVALATVPAKPLAVTTEAIVTVPVPAEPLAAAVSRPSAPTVRFVFV